MDNFKIIALLHLGLYMMIGSTDSGGTVEFTPKYIIVGGEGGITFGHLGPYAKFQSRTFTPSGLFLVGGEEGFVDIKGFLCHR
jgi:hypothetical protein